MANFAEDFRGISDMLTDCSCSPVGHVLLGLKLGTDAAGVGGSEAPSGSTRRTVTLLNVGLYGVQKSAFGFWNRHARANTRRCFVLLPTGISPRSAVHPFSGSVERSFLVTCD